MNILSSAGSAVRPGAALVDSGPRLTMPKAGVIDMAWCGLDPNPRIATTAHTIAVAVPRSVNLVPLEGPR